MLLGLLNSIGFHLYLSSSAALFLHAAFHPFGLYAAVNSHCTLLRPAIGTSSCANRTPLTMCFPKRLLLLVSITLHVVWAVRQPRLRAMFRCLTVVKMPLLFHLVPCHFVLDAISIVRPDTIRRGHERGARETVCMKSSLAGYLPPIRSVKAFCRTNLKGRCC